MRWCYLLILAPFAALAQPSGSTGVQPTYPGPVSASLPGPSLDLNFINGLPVDSRITYTGGNGSYFNASGSIVAATTNVPRIDYDPVTHAVLGLLIEEARTNLLLNSATLVTQSVTTTAVAYTLSFYSAGSVALSGSCSGSLAGTGTFPTRVSLTITATAGTCTVTVSGSVLNANLEAGAYATSWIPTAGATATRTVDQAIMTLPAGLYSTVAGSFAVQAISSGADAGAYARFAQFDDTTANNSVNIDLAAGGPQYLSAVTTAGSFQVATGGTFTLGSVMKTAVAFANNSLDAAANGILMTHVATGLAVPPATTLRFGTDRGANVQASTRFGRFRYWPRQLGRTELNGFTL